MQFGLNMGTETPNFFMEKYIKEEKLIQSRSLDIRMAASGRGITNVKGYWLNISESFFHFVSVTYSEDL